MKRDNIYRKRLDKHMDELKWLYMELYNSQDMFDGLLKGMEGFYGIPFLSFRPCHP